VRNLLFPNLKFKVRDRRDACPTAFLCRKALFLCAFCAFLRLKWFHILFGKEVARPHLLSSPRGEEITHGAFGFSGGGSGRSPLGGLSAEIGKLDRNDSMLSGLTARYELGHFAVRGKLLYSA
jgi:hypothetical protein